MRGVRGAAVARILEQSEDNRSEEDESGADHG